ncbi:NAD(P)-binding protein [Cryphonectria parasitica EP155]|uniref:NAD(P)-binding protein n=1 Tax=Cryphonectria parasitica (strain ATCC 38755 / EP155) TaxID=660469 RepID=A0A9P5CM33_CRYP1|nr:NAD(P)-binding protein [Cryphonectria parasitica EP155]KAF3763954.1 NAD(P)-binding protein [Cryphonectria parasitica EP155]
MPTIAVLGGTGAQGGSVVRQLQKSSTWKIRILTRNANSDKAKALNSQGIEVVAADVNDEASLVNAFKGIDAIFAVTTYWESVLSLGRDGAGEEELQQLKNVANAAQKTPTLSHFIVSSLPPAEKSSGGQFPVPHLDYKAKAVDWIKEALPELYSKTSQIWPGWYPTNLATLPMVRFLEIPGSYGGYLFTQPSKPSSLLPIVGDIDHNFGIVVEGLLKAGKKAYEKIAVVITEYLPFTDVVRVFEEVTGKRAAYAEISDEAAIKLYGVYGAEYAAQLRWSEKVPNWEQIDPQSVISLEELGVKDKLIGFKGALETLKARIV